MKKQLMVIGTFLVLLFLAMAASISRAQGSGPRAANASMSSLGNGFTYQGRLTDGGSPANGDYDFQFILYDALSGGGTVGSPMIFDNEPVSDGLFTVELDFGNVFTGQALWLQVAVRPGSSTGAYTTLTTRQALTAAPYALGLQTGASIQHNPSGYALGITGGNWDPNTMDGDVLVGDASYRFKIAVATNGGGAGDVRLRAQGGTDRMMLGGGANDMLTITSSNVGIGTIFPDADSTLHVTTGSSKNAAYLQNTAASGTVYGLFAQTDSTDGTAVEGNASATSGPALGVLGRTASPLGNGVSGIANATSGSAIGAYGRSSSPDGYGIYGWNDDTSGSGVSYGVYGKSDSPTGFGVYSNGNAHVEGLLTWKPINGYVSIPSASFRPEDSSATYTSSAGWLRNSTASIQYFDAGVQLPQGATITKLTFYWNDTSTSNGSVSLVRNTFDQSASQIGTASSTGSGGNGNSSDTSLFYTAVDNSQYAYLLRASLPANTNVFLQGVVIEYSIDRPY